MGCPTGPDGVPNEGQTGCPTGGRRGGQTGVARRGGQTGVARQGGQTEGQMGPDGVPDGGLRGCPTGGQTGWPDGARRSARRARRGGGRKDYVLLKEKMTYSVYVSCKSSSASDVSDTG
jgi:hypothetical protein